MGKLDILKGAYLTAGAVDETLPLAAGETAERGTILVKTAANTFRRCQAADHASKLVPYVALVPDDKVAGMAGSVGTQATPNAGSLAALPAGSLGVTRSASDATLLAAGTAVVTAVPLTIDGTFQFDQFTGTPAVDALLTFADNGKLAVTTTSGDTICGKVLRGPEAVYDNKKAVNAFMQGGVTSVITFVSYFVPSITLA